jgi:methionine-gamma-lyase
MAEDRSHADHIGNHALHPETLMLGYGYDPTLSEGSVKPPVFLTSTFVFRSAEEGRDFFDYVSGRKEAPDRGSAGLV